MSRARGPSRPGAGTGEFDSGRSAFARRWVVSFLLLLALAAAWIGVTPPGGGPDEPAHAIKAAAVASGQLTGRHTPDGAGARFVEVPRRLDRLNDLPGCFAFNGAAPADCSPSFEGSSRVGPVYTRAGISPPLYYGLVGAPLRYIPTLDGLYLTRLLSAAISCALVATAIQLAVATRSRFLATAVLVAWTPMALSLVAVVNPSSLEISAAVLVWTAGLLLVRPESVPPWLARWLPWTFAVGASLFVLSRQLSPLFLACILGCLLVAAAPGRIKELLTDRRIRMPAVVTTLATLAAAAYLVLLPADPWVGGPEANRSLRASLSFSLGRQGDMYHQMIGRFGWLDNSPPVVVRLAWTAAIGVLLLGGLALGARRLAAAIGACITVSVVVPAVFEATQMNAFGPLLQGRYILPLAMGVVLIGGRAIDGIEPVVLRRLVPLVGWLLALVVMGHVVSLYFAARRFAAGIQSAILFFHGHERWNPGIPVIVPVAVGSLAITALAWLLWRQVSPVGVELRAGDSSAGGDGAQRVEPADPAPAESDRGAAVGAVTA